MIIDERGLVRAIKAAHKRIGYNILNMGEQVCIYTTYWYVRCDWDRFPRKALATIVEHIGMIPQEGQALMVNSKEEVQVAIPEIVGQEVDGWMKGYTDERVTKVPVQFMGAQIYQAVEGRNCFGVAPVGLDILDIRVSAHNEAAVSDDKRLLWDDDGAVVVLAATRPTGYWENTWMTEVWAAMESVDLHKKEE